MAAFRLSDAFTNCFIQAYNNGISRWGSDTQIVKQDTNKDDMDYEYLNYDNIENVNEYIKSKYNSLENESRSVLFIQNEGYNEDSLKKFDDTGQGTMNFVRLKLDVNGNGNGKMRFCYIGLEDFEITSISNCIVTLLGKFRNPNMTRVSWDELKTLATLPTLTTDIIISILYNNYTEEDIYTYETTFGTELKGANMIKPDDNIKDKINNEIRKNLRLIKFAYAIYEGIKSEKLNILRDYFRTTIEAHDVKYGADVIIIMMIILGFKTDGDSNQVEYLRQLNKLINEQITGKETGPETGPETITKKICSIMKELGGGFIMTLDKNVIADACFMKNLKLYSNKCGTRIDLNKVLKDNVRDSEKLDEITSIYTKNIIEERFKMLSDQKQPMFKEDMERMRQGKLIEDETAIHFMSRISMKKDSVDSLLLFLRKMLTKISEEKIEEINNYDENQLVEKYNQLFTSYNYIGYNNDFANQPMETEYESNEQILHILQLIKKHYLIMKDFIDFVDTQRDELNTFIHIADIKFKILHKHITKKKLQMLQKVEAVGFKTKNELTHIIYEKYMKEVYNQLKTLYTNLFTKKDKIVNNFRNDSNYALKYNKLKNEFKENIKNKLNDIKKWQVILSKTEDLPRSSLREVQKREDDSSGKAVDNMDKSVRQMLRIREKEEQEKLEKEEEDRKKNPNYIREELIKLNIEVMNSIIEVLNKDYNDTTIEEATDVIENIGYVAIKTNDDDDDKKGQIAESGDAMEIDSVKDEQWEQKDEYYQKNEPEQYQLGTNSYNLTEDWEEKEKEEKEQKQASIKRYGKTGPQRNLSGITFDPPKRPRDESDSDSNQETYEGDQEVYDSDDDPLPPPPPPQKKTKRTKRGGLKMQIKRKNRTLKKKKN